MMFLDEVEGLLVQIFLIIWKCEGVDFLGDKRKYSDNFFSFKSGAQNPCSYWQ